SRRGRGGGREAGAARADGGVLSRQLHASEVVAERGPELRSAPEQSPLEEFLATAELAGTRFVAERLNAQIVSAQSCTGLLTAQEAQRIQQLHQENQEFLRIPRPRWDRTTSAEDLKQAERESFLEWRRQLAHLEEEKKLILTPFERNLEFWRQLWRVIERSDIVVQIVDARNPLLFRCQDLESYVKEVCNDKENMILINKADLLSEEQRAAWAQFFEKEGVKVVFWSALAECERLCRDTKELGAEGGAEHSSGSEDESSSQEDDDTAQGSAESVSTGSTLQTVNQLLLSDDNSSDEYEDCEEDEEEAWQTCSEDESGDNVNAVAPERMESRTDGAAVHNTVQEQNRNVRNFSHLVQRNELLEIFKTVHDGPRVKDGEVNVGLVGYPNVGKSSTINTILGNKKVSVSATPGRTKHFQTLYVEPGLCLCDCPGLVMPSFVSTKAEMICSGILPIDQMRDHVPPISLISFAWAYVCQHIPRNILEATYGINIIRPREDEDPDRKPTAEELLTAYGYMRGFMTAHGQPDQPRSARYVLKDYVNGKLLYCHPPPGIDSNDFQHQHQRCPENRIVQATGQVKPEKNTKAKQIENVVDKTFFHQENVRALMKGVRAAMGYRPGSGLVPVTASNPGNVVGKPWKKHGNRNKKEKIRRITKHLEA
ncbi:LSG1 GTPase, partial [Menura novaehollandiae]|nr:LSG1 GTPase [Menura novaehollandiae]